MSAGPVIFAVAVVTFRLTLTSSAVDDKNMPYIATVYTKNSPPFRTWANYRVGNPHQTFSNTFPSYPLKQKASLASRVGGRFNNAGGRLNGKLQPLLVKTSSRKSGTRDVRIGGRKKVSSSSRTLGIDGSGFLIPTI